MPLYTYVAHYKGRTCVDQDRRSNYAGFAPLVLGRMADGGLLGSSNNLRNEMAHKAYRSAWAAIPNRLSVWRTAFELDGVQLELYAIQTKD